MFIKVQVLSHTLDISCGDGKQKFKWLASVVQSRIRDSGILRSNFEKGDYIVTEIRNQFNELINPNDLIFEHVGPSGLLVKAVVSTTYPVDEWENPEVNDWIRAAYIKSKVGLNWATELGAWRESIRKLKVAEGKENSAGIELNKTMSAATLVHVGNNFSPAELESAFDLDWGGMKWAWSSFTDQQKTQLGETLKDNYQLLCNIFSHYCGIGQSAFL